MTAPDKPGLSNEGFIKRQRIEIDLNLGLYISYKREFNEALDRLEALVKANEDRDLTPKNLEEFRLKLFNDPVAYAYYNMGAAVERDKQLSPEERTRKNWDAIYSAISCGFEKKILPDIWTAEFASVDKAEKKICQECGLDFETGFHSEENGTPDCSQHPFVSKAEKDAKEGC